MGWPIAIALEPLVRSVHSEGLVLPVPGGLTDTLGVIFYAWRRLPYDHALWDVFVLVGSISHFSCAIGSAIPPAA